jgi:hypothetical protein
LRRRRADDERFFDWKYVPNLDATIITRLLDAGATIKAKHIARID